MFTNLLASTGEALNFIDKAVLVVYLVVIVGIGCWTGMRSRKGTKAAGTTFLPAVRFAGP